VTGTPYQGEIAFDLSPGDASAAWGGWSFVANPYASPVRWTADNAAWLASGVSNVVAVRRDTLIDGQLRSKVLYHDATLGGGVIRAGEGFWVRSYTSSPSLHVKEAAKVDAMPGSAVEPLEYLVLSVQQGGISDEAIIVFNAAATDAFEAE